MRPATDNLDRDELTSNEVKALRAEVHQLKETVADLFVENRMLKKSMRQGEGNCSSEVAAHEAG